MVNSKVITQADISKYGRMDTHFYLKMKPQVDEFLKGHSVDSKGKIKPLKRQRTAIDRKLTTDDYVLIYALVQYYNAFKKMSEATRYLQKSISFELGDE